MTQKTPQTDSPSRLNDFSVRIATINGTGSQSANLVLVRTLFEMGITTSGKNLFPSNIAGLPTWYTVRINPKSYIGNRRGFEIVVAMNKTTAEEDISGLAPGGIAIVDEAAAPENAPDGVTVHRVPFAKLSRQIDASPRLRKLIMNMIYIGVLTEVLGLDPDKVAVAVETQFPNKPKAVAFNLEAVTIGRTWAEENIDPQHVYRVQAGTATDGKIMIEGNEAAAYGAVFGGVQFAAWYPITPSSSMAESLAGALERYRLDPVTGKAQFAVLQAEDEIAAMGMVIGAGWCGARSLTATSGPGISLMSEFAGLSSFAEIPGVIVNVQRMGPSTGLPTRTSQGDIQMMATASHGDTNHPILFPRGPSEYFDMLVNALDLAERLQTLIFVAADLDLGMNFWIDDTFTYPQEPIDRGKILNEEDLDQISDFARYRDVDGDGIPQRTVPGTIHPDAAYFLRGSGHDEYGRYSEKPEIYQQLLERLQRKITDNAHLLPSPVIELAPGADVGVIAYGTSHWAVSEARDLLAEDNGMPLSYLRVRSWPFTDEVRTFVENHRQVYVVEQNRDGQLTGLLQTSMPDLAARIEVIAHYDGEALPVEFVTESVLEREGKETV